MADNEEIIFSTNKRRPIPTAITDDLKSAGEAVRCLSIDKIFTLYSGIYVNTRQVHIRQPTVHLMGGGLRYVP